MNFTKSEILARCRRALGLEPSRTDYTLSFTDGIDLDSFLLDRLRRGYLRLLREAPPEVLSTSDLADDFPEHEWAGGGMAVLRLPSDCVRIFSLRLENWDHAVAVESADGLPGFLAQCDNRFTAPQSCNPRAVVSVDGRRIFVAPAEESVTVVHASGVADPGEDCYSLSEDGLTLLFENIKIELP